MLRSRPIGDCVRIKDGDVGAPARPKLAALGQAESLGRQRGHFADCVRQLYEMAFADVFTQNFGKAAVVARMRVVIAAEDAGRRDG